MKAPIVLAAPLLLTAVAQAQIGPGELVLTYPTGAGSSIEHYSTSGVVEGNIGGMEGAWISSALVPDGRIVVHNNDSDNGIRVLSPTGALLHTFSIQVLSYSADIDLFSDWTIAICSRGEGILMYDLAGNHQGTISVPGMLSPQGCQTQIDDTIWVADTGAGPWTGDGIIWHLDRQGAVLQSFPVPFNVSDVAQAADGSVWVAGWGGEIALYQADGTPILPFAATINHSLKTLWSLAIGSDGVIWASGHYDSMVYGYDSNGTVVSSFNGPAAGNSTYSFVSPGISAESAFCFGDGVSMGCPCGNISSNGGGCTNSTGTGAILTAEGVPSVSSDSLTFMANHVIPGQAALLFAGGNQVNGGNGQFFGDGLLCVNGGIQRVGVSVPNASGDASWGPGIVGALGLGGGDTRYFQAWYRDTAGIPCGSGFNLSSALKLVVAP